MFMLNVPSDDQLKELRQTIRLFVESNLSLDAVGRESIDARIAQVGTIWARLASELGVQGLHIPSDSGGHGFDLRTSALVVEELGRHLAPIPYLSTACATNAILLTASAEQKGRLLSKMLSSNSVVTLAWREHGRYSSLDEPRTVARRCEGGWSIEGHKVWVVDGSQAKYLVVLAKVEEECGGGNQLFVVDAETPGVTSHLEESIDGTRPVASVQFSGAAAERLTNDCCSASDSTPLWIDHALVLLAAEMVGSASSVLDLTIKYVSGRRQFGRPVGTFQAVKHECVACQCLLTQATSATDFALQLIANGAPARETSIHARLAVVLASEALHRSARSAIQLHGAVGFTWEFHPHRFLRRAKLNEQILGSSFDHLQYISNVLPKHALSTT